MILIAYDGSDDAKWPARARSTRPSSGREAFFRPKLLSSPTDREQPMILIAYDGSDDAKAAIEHVASLVSGQPATVVTVWEPYVQILTRYPTAGAMMAGEDTTRMDDASSASADEKAEEGAALARSHGIEASGHGV